MTSLTIAVAGVPGSPELGRAVAALERCGTDGAQLLTGVPAAVALTAASGEVVVLLDADIEVVPGWLAPLLAAFEDPDVGAVAPLHVAPDGRVLHAGAALDEGVVPVLLHAGAPAGHPAVVRDRDLTILGGGCRAVRRSAFLALGGLARDGSPPGQAELCMRLGAAGLSCRHVGGALVVDRAPARPPVADAAEAVLLRRAWRGHPADRRALLAEDGVVDADWADCRWSGPLFGAGADAAEGRAFLRALVDDGRRPAAVEGARGPLRADAAELCEPWLLAALNRTAVRVPAAETYVHPGAAVPAAEPPATGPLVVVGPGAGPRRDRRGARPGLGWWGPLLGRSGYAAAGRGTLQAATGAGLPVRALSADVPPEGMEPPPLSLPPQDFSPAAWVVHHPPTLATGADVWGEVQAALGAPVVGATCFEAEGVPPGWVEASRAVREVWVPSGFNARTFAAAGMDAGRIHVVPYPVDATLLAEGPRPPEAGGPTTFLSVFEWTWRKGWDVLLRAWAEEFTADEPVRLVVLTYRGAGAATARDIPAEAVALLRSLGHDPEGIADVELRLDPVPHGGMPALYRSADALVLPSRGEGAGMPVLEAAAAGLPVIATAFGGHEELMDPETAFPVGVERMVPASDDLVRDNPLYRGMLLAEPGLASLRAQMRLVAADPAEARRRAARARELVMDRFSPAATGRALVARAAELTGMPPVRAVAG
jgi:hypothetical protein